MILDHYFNELNFLLDPGSIPPSEVHFTGQVIGDLNGNGVQNAQDVGVYNMTVYADLNHTGQLEFGEPYALTDADGNYDLVVLTATPNTFTIAVDPPLDWTPTSPASGYRSDFAAPGDVLDGFTFLVQPPSTPSNVGNGTIFGFVFNDKNGNTVQDGIEAGLPGAVVFLDTNTNGLLDGGELSTVTSASGAYSFNEIPPGTVQVDVVIEEPYLLTYPAAGFRTVTLSAGQVATGLNFGVRNLAIYDFGDLAGAGYGTTTASALVVSGFSLGPTVDAEIRARMLMETFLGSGVYEPNYELSGIADDQNVSPTNFDDEDGVVLIDGKLHVGSNMIQVTVLGVGGYLQGWMDLNHNGTFDSNEQIFTDMDLNPGTYKFAIELPGTFGDGDLIASRFRWGTPGLSYDTADTQNPGEIEDYLFEFTTHPPGDYNSDNVVDDADYLLWKSTFGSTADLRADGNANGVIDSGDYTIWRNNLGKSYAPGAGAAALAASESDGTDADFVDALVVEAPLATALTSVDQVNQFNELAAGLSVAPDIESSSGAAAGVCANDCVIRESSAGRRASAVRSVRIALFCVGRPLN